MTRDEVIQLANDALVCQQIWVDEDYSVELESVVLFATLVAAKKRNDVLEEVAREFDKMKVFGDTAASFAIFVREMKNG